MIQQYLCRYTSIRGCAEVKGTNSVLVDRHNSLSRNVAGMPVQERGAYSSRRATAGAGIAHDACRKSRTERVATMPVENLPSIVLASERQPVHVLGISDMGVLITRKL